MSAGPGEGAGHVGVAAATEELRLRVPVALEGERVDRGLSLLAGVSRAQASRLVAEGRARVGGAAVATGSRRLRSGELLEVDLSSGAEGAQLPAGDRPGPPPHGLDQGAEPGRQPLARVVFADADLVVVDKPAGLVVHPGAGNPEGTLVQQLVSLFPDMVDAGPAGDRPGIVHRLDKGTSGLLVVARTAAAREGLVLQMARRSTERRYLALVHGQVEEDEGAIDAPLGRSPSQRVKMAVVHGGRSARTQFWALARSSSPLPATLVACRLETGRTHQVRVHFGAIGHPVVGDDRYTKASLLAQAQLAWPDLDRPWLHAARLGFVHPLTGEPMSFTSPLPAELEEVLEASGLRVPTTDF
jgi:23S rRNA pseudouridine1911/1915/1917 synthase